ncbi:MAG: type II secretion system F family protein [Candidatus Velamenicoccus archaeovorus]
MSPALAAGCLAALPGLLLAIAADLADRARIRHRVGGRPAGGGVPRSVWASGARLPAIGAGAGLGAGFLLWGLPGAMVGAALGAVIPVIRRRRAAAAGRRELERQLGPAAGALAAGLRAGRSIPGSILVAADEVGPPLGPSLREVVERTSLGTPLADALQGWAARMGTPDARLLVGVLRLHARSGGEIPAALDRLVETLRARAAVVSEIGSLTAQARLSGAILGLLPVGFLLFLSVTSRQDLVAALQARTGQVALAVGLVLEGLAFLWIRRLLRVDP